MQILLLALLLYSLSAFGSENIIDGTDGHDQIVGTASNDTITGGMGYDTMQGLEGDDVFFVFGSINDFDTIDGGEGTDTIKGSDQDDIFGLYTFKSIERIDGGEGINIIRGSSHSHTWDFSNTELLNIQEIDGQSGHDIIIGSKASDTIIGGKGFDSLHGGGGDDIFIVNGTENDIDTIKGDTGFDQILGGIDDDDIGLANFDAQSSVEVINGQEGSNRILGDMYDDFWDFTNTELINIDTINGLSGHDYIIGSKGDDRIIGGPGFDTLNGGEGDDWFLVFGTQDDFDTIMGGNGYDTILGSDLDDDIGLYHFTQENEVEKIDGGAGVNRIIGYQLNHKWDFTNTELVSIYEINGQAGHDDITGSAGDDVIVGGEGSDKLSGGAGDDVFLVSGHLEGFDTVYGGSGFDAIEGSELDDTFGLNTLTAVNELERIDGKAGLNKIVGSQYDQVWDFTNIELINIYSIDGQSGHDRITGSIDSDLIIGGEGYDTLDGGGGDDIFQINGLNEGFDSIKGGNGYDVILGSSGDDNFGLYALTIENSIEKIDGGQGHNQIIGLDYNHTWDFTHTELINIALINAGGGHDTVIGSQGDDTIIGGKGFDTLNGGEGSDRYIINEGDGIDYITDSGSALDHDIIVYSDTFHFGVGLAKENLWFSIENNNLRIDVIGTDDAVIIPGWTETSPLVEYIHTGVDVLKHDQISTLISAMSSYTAPQGVGAQLTPSMKASLYPVMSSTWNVDNQVDSDGDGVEDALDAFPHDPSEFADSDGDGVGDNADAFANNPDASIDTDGDGSPDLWNASCDFSCQQNSSLTLDAFPNDANEWLDTDGDGTGNNADEDSDNDGFSDELEIAEGTDPLDPNSYPVANLASITLTSNDNQTVTSKAFTVSGVVTFGDLAISKFYYIDVSKPQVATFININNDGTFSSTVNLSKGINHYRFILEDVSNTQTIQDITINYEPVLDILAISPIGGTEVVTQTLDVFVRVQSSELPVVKLNLQPGVLQSSSHDEYVFTANVGLLPGDNTLELEVIAGGESSKQMLSYFFKPDDLSMYPIPSLSVSPSQDHIVTANQAFPISVNIDSQVGRLTAQINGLAVQVSQLGEAQFYIDEILNLTEGDNVIEIKVTDALQQTQMAQLHIKLDTSAPTVQFNDGFALPPAVNQIEASQFVLSGVVTETDVASVFISGEQVALELDAAGHYIFSHPVRIVANQDFLVEIEATDILGNSSQQGLYFKTVNNLSMEWVTPIFPVEWTFETSTQKPFAVKLISDSGGESYQVQLIGENKSEEIPFNQIGKLLTGNLPEIAEKGDYQLSISAYQSGQLISQLIGKLKVLSQEDLPIEVTSIVPEREGNQIEPDTYLQVNLNRPIDPSKLEIIVRRTLHGLTYMNKDTSGKDFLHAKGMQLVEVNIDREIISGAISILPDDSSFIFYPQYDLGYGAEIDWQVKYNGELLSKQRFKTRDLPTMIEGGVSDSLNQKLQGVSVELEEMGYVTKTNSDGGFAFGYGLAADQNIPDGRYHLLINRDYAFPKIGQIRIPVDIKGGHRNQFGLFRVPNLSEQIQWIAAPQGISEVNLAQGDLKLLLNDNQLDFPASNQSIHAQFIPSTAVVRDSYPGTIPLWFYQIQPFGIQPSGPIDIEIKAPLLRGSLDYLGAVDDKEVYAFLLGYNKIKDVIEPIGVFEIKDGVLKTHTPVELQNIDYLGYGHIKYEYQEQFKRFINNEISFIELVAQVTVD